MTQACTRAPTEDSACVNYGTNQAPVHASPSSVRDPGCPYVRSPGIGDRLQHAGQTLDLEYVGAGAGDYLPQRGVSGVLVGGYLQGLPTQSHIGFLIAAQHGMQIGAGRGYLPGSHTIFDGCGSSQGTSRGHGEDVGRVAGEVDALLFA